MDRAKVKSIRADLNDILESDAVIALEKMYGVKLSFKQGSRFDNQFLTTTLIVADCVTQDGQIFDPEQKQWEQNCRSLGLDKNDYGKMFQVGDKRYKIIEVNTRRPKYPVSCKCLTDGKKYKFGVYDIKIFLQQ